MFYSLFIYIETERERGFDVALGDEHFPHPTLGETKVSNRTKIANVCEVNNVHRGCGRLRPAIV